MGLAVAASFVLAACGAPAPTAAPAAESKPAEVKPTEAPKAAEVKPTEAPKAAEVKPTEAPAAAPAKAVTIRWRTRPGDAGEQKVYEEINATLNEKLKDKGITTVYDPGVNQGYFEKIQTELAADNAPDIFWVGGANTADFVATGKIADLKPMIDADPSFKLADFYDGPMKELVRDGKVYGLPRDISTMVVYFNADLFKAAGLKNPAELAAEGKWDWAALSDAAAKLTDASKKQYGVTWGNWWGPNGWFVYSAGGNFYNADKTGCGLDSPATTEGANAALALLKFSPEGDADGEALFTGGQVGMLWSGRWTTPGLRSGAKFNWDVAEMPKGKTNSTWLFWGPYLMSTKADAKAGWEVLKVLTSPEVTGKVAGLGANIPPLKAQAAVDAFLKSAPPANGQAFLNGAGYKDLAVEAPLWTGNFGKFSDAFGKAWGDMVAGKLKPEELGKTACAAAADAFKK
jgi:multiple sugar transport system substrate-binding protein